MSRDILSRLFTTTRALELEYRKVSLAQEHEAELSASAQIKNSGELSPVTELAIFADAIWQ
jgi:hypothetical protein